MTFHPNESVEAVILAGSRPGGDALADAYGTSVKALVPIAGTPMLSHVAGRLVNCPAIDKVHISAQNFDAFLKNEKTAWIAKDPSISLTQSKSTIAATIDDLIENDDLGLPILITTADNVLLSDDMVTYFLSKATGSDIAIAVVEKTTLLAKYPNSIRTWLKFRGGHYSGANLFYFGSDNARVILQYWRAVEQDRKKGWKILSIFGPWLLFLVLIRRISIDQMAARVGKKLGLDIRIVQMPQAEACIDVDKQADLELVEEIMSGGGNSSRL